MAVYAFAFQIYGDFSGYTDIARGVAKCLGFEIPLNFNLPYFATSPRDFWNRWHISLSNWLRDYLYIPLGGNRGGTFLTYRNLMVTMALGGLWHGPVWHFVVWGIYHGMLLVGHRLASPWLEKIQPSDPVDRACWKGLRIFVTFHLVCLGWIFFRAESIQQALGMLSAIVNRPAIPVASYLVPVMLLIIPLWLVQLRAIRGARSERDRAHAVVRAERVLHGVLLRDRPGWPVRRAAVYLLCVLMRRGPIPATEAEYGCTSRAIYDSSNDGPGCRGRELRVCRGTQKTNGLVPSTSSSHSREWFKTLPCHHGPYYYAMLNRASSTTTWS